MKPLRKLLTVLIILATLVVGVLFALQNTIQVPLDLLVYTFGAQSLALWVLLAFVLGGVLGMIISSIILVRTRASLKSATRKLEKNRVEISSLQTEVSSRTVS